MVHPELSRSLRSWIVFTGLEITEDSLGNAEKVIEVSRRLIPIVVLAPINPLDTHSREHRSRSVSEISYIPIGCHTVFTSVKARRRERLGVARQSGFTGALRTRLTVPAASIWRAFCSSESVIPVRSSAFTSP